MTGHVSADHIRARFSDALSAMYRQEVPLYADLIAIVEEVNAATLAADAGLRDALTSSGEIARLGAERHGAIRVGTAEELDGLRRVFAAMGMVPVGYYDLTVAGVPVHSTAFRPIDEEALRTCPFRVFTSLLRLDLIGDPDLRDAATAILAARRILSTRALVLADQAAAAGGLDEAEAAEFVSEVLETFRWHAQALVDAETYQRLLASHRLIADIVSFKGPHINHLTPRTLDIDAAQAAMLARGMQAKAVIEGPPPRKVPILLRQTSFNALSETIRFAGDQADPAGAHTARFGEIEQRGLALTRKGRALYDALLAQARDEAGAQDEGYAARLTQAFAAFPDDLAQLAREGLGFFRYALTPAGEAAAGSGGAEGQFEDWIAQGLVQPIPMTYEDFLPVSAAGIFQSNLGGEEQRVYAGNASQAVFEAALGAPIADPFALYEAQEARARAAVTAALGGAVTA
ncbi:VOC family protein [Novosphingobium colocasiae]|uniref:2-oxoadipate dioxygenase/decarboxylase HglS n=1 Tax=Novosphingobium colocasiae TaxID=1256513 RepID=UPI0035B26665